MTDSPWMTRPEVAERLRVAEKTLAKWACLKTGPKYARFGGRVRYHRDDVIAWENEQFGQEAS